ncbi:MAG: putative RNA methyltransferase [Dethiobacteria bacterium]|jgi:23S rRNA (guanine745-N1)-methyltransferase|nr:methyltransferase domain-containing protein [Bacillota bacterium]
MKKQERYEKYIQQFVSIFSCPLCSASMRLEGSGSLVCAAKHTFDLAKQGYVNFMTRPVKSKYDKELFEARKRVVDSALFEPLHKVISELICSEEKGLKQRLKERTLIILDAGCGEGSHLFRIKNKLTAHFRTEVTGVGIDLAKEGVSIAAKSYAGMIWCVADLAHSPFKGDTFDVILNILSPANYAEFNRLLKKDDGMIIKVIPGSDYLKELREVLYPEAAGKNYSNQRITERFKTGFGKIEKYRVSEIVSLKQSLIPSLFRMTPLSWPVLERKIIDFDAIEIPAVSIDLDILVGRKEK